MPESVTAKPANDRGQPPAEVARNKAAPEVRLANPANDRGQTPAEAADDDAAPKVRPAEPAGSRTARDELGERGTVLRARLISLLIHVVLVAVAIDRMFAGYAAAPRDTDEIPIEIISPHALVDLSALPEATEINAVDIAPAVDETAEVTNSSQSDFDVAEPTSTPAVAAPVQVSNASAAGEPIVVADAQAETAAIDGIEDANIVEDLNIVADATINASEITEVEGDPAAIAETAVALAEVDSSELVDAGAAISEVGDAGELTEASTVDAAVVAAAAVTPAAEILQSDDGTTEPPPYDASIGDLTDAPKKIKDVPADIDLTHTHPTLTAVAVAAPVLADAAAEIRDAQVDAFRVIETHTSAESPETLPAAGASDGRPASQDAPQKAAPIVIADTPAETLEGGSELDVAIAGNAPAEAWESPAAEVAPIALADAAAEFTDVEDIDDLGIVADATLEALNVQEIQGDPTAPRDDAALLQSAVEAEVASAVIDVKETPTAPAAQAEQMTVASAVVDLTAVEPVDARRPTAELSVPDGQSSVARTAVNKPAASKAAPKPAPKRGVAVGSASINAGRLAKTYREKLYAHLSRFRVLPAAARGGALTGTVVMSFTLNAQGQVIAVRYLKGSGNRTLDTAGRSMIVSASPFPAIPDELRTNRLVVQVPIRFNR